MEHKFYLKPQKRVYCFISIIPSFTELVGIFTKKGGRIDKYYLKEWNQSKQTLVYLNGWFSGKNTREAMIKAMAPAKKHPSLLKT